MIVIVIIFIIFIIVGSIAILINQFSGTKFRISNLKWELNKKYNIRKDCIYCERGGFSDEKIAKQLSDPDIFIAESDYDFQCSLFKYKLDENFNCNNCKKYKSK